MTFRKIYLKYHFHNTDIEALIWFGALCFFSLINPEIAGDRFYICPFKISGIQWCPGCGLGHSISFFLHANIIKSFEAHPCGITAVFILGHRICKLLRISLKFKILNY
jgi:hypothetical protein